jgi:crossover junction endodeoxyribonuclease RusA
MPAHVRVTEAEMRRILAQPVAPKRRKAVAVPPVAGYPCRSSVFLVLPYPPLNNRYYRHVGGRAILSAAARAYRSEVVVLVAQQLSREVQRPFNNRLWCDIWVHAPDLRRYDIDAPIKALLDAMQFAGIYLNDWQIDDLHIWRDRVAKGGCVEVHLKPMG